MPTEPRRRDAPDPMDSRLPVITCVAVAMLLAHAGCSSGSGRNSPIVRRDSSLYLDARRADALGLTPVASFAAGFPRGVDLAWAMGNEETGANAPGEPDEEAGADEIWFRRILHRYKSAVDYAWGETDEPVIFEPLRDARLRYLQVDETVSFYNEQGREFTDGAHLFLSDRASATFFNRVVVTAEPELSLLEQKAPPRDGETAVNLRFQELTASVRLGVLEVTAGRMPLWWGPGRHGSLLLSNNARPFDLVRLSTAGPQLLPGILGYLGFVHGEVFATRLESARAIERPYLAGLRVSSRLLPWLELGASRTAQFGGGDRAVTPATVWDVFTAQTENDPNDPGNQLASLDARIVVPLEFQPFELYAEVGGEDEANGFFSKEAYLTGLYLPRLGPWRDAEITIEMANTTVSGEKGIWYRNINYPDGYTYHDRIVGHHVGTDGLDLFAEARLRPTDAWTVIVSYDYEEHLREDPVSERLHQIRLAVELRLWRGLLASVALGIDRWSNFRQVRGRDETGHFMGVGARWEF